MLCWLGLLAWAGDILKVAQIDKSGQPRGGHLGDQGLKVVHGIIWVDYLHLLLAPEAHIELPEKKKIHAKEIQK